MVVRVRFAPSPTGPVHVGNIRVAIYNWLFARSQGGKFFVRLEDTDVDRSSYQWSDKIVDALHWLGLDYCADEFALSPIPGDWASEPPPYPGILCQSNEGHRSVYSAVLDELLDNGTAYKGSGDKEGCILFRIEGKEMAFDDIIYGHLTKPIDKNYDFVIRKSNGDYTFHFANVVDDIYMRITHVIRGNDHIENTFRHVKLFEAINATWPYVDDMGEFGTTSGPLVGIPKFAHLPMITNVKGKPFSKRDGDAFVGDFRNKGYLPEALFNYLALLGWSPGDGQELLSAQEMAACFDLTRVQRSAGIWDGDKLRWMNGQYLRDMSRKDFGLYVNQFSSQFPWYHPFPERLVDCLQVRTKSAEDLVELSRPFVEYDLSHYDVAAVEKRMLPDTSKHLQDFLAIIAAVEPLTAETAETALRKVAKTFDVKAGTIIHPLRLATTGMSHGIGVFDIVEIMGREKTVRRIEDFLRAFGGNSGN